MDNFEESIRLCSIFPEEVWMLVFDAVDDPQDLMRISNASPFFSKILHPRKTTHLFPEVLKVLEKEDYLNPKSFQLATLRLVCKTWLNSVTSLLSTPPRYLEPGKLKLENGAQNLNRDICHSFRFCFIVNWHLLENIISELLSELGSPIISSFPPTRHVKIIDGSFYPREIVQRFFRKFGSQFISAEIDAKLVSDPVVFYNMLVSYIRWLPNLKALYVKSPSLQNVFIRTENGQSAFPTMKRLELLSLENVSTSMTNMILKANCHVKILIFPLLRQEANRSIQKNFAVVNDIHTLSMKSFDHGCFKSWSPQWNLRYLTISFGFNFAPCLILENLFEKLACFGKTLKRLDLELPKRYDDPETTAELCQTSQTVVLKLPNLERFRLTSFHYISLDFMLGLESMEYLFFHRRHYETFPPTSLTATKEKINFNNGFSGAEKFIKCNIWELFPSLKKVQLKSNSASVSTYEKGCAGYKFRRYLHPAIPEEFIEVPA